MELTKNIFSELVENSNQIIALIDADHNIEFMNKAGRVAFNYNNSQRLKCYKTICHATKPLKHCSETCEKINNDTLTITHNNYSYQLISKPIANGARIDYLTHVTQNNTQNAFQNEHQALNEEYEATINKLENKNILIQEDKESFELLFNNMNTAFAYHKIITNSKGEPIDYLFLDCNPNFENFTGLKKKDIIGKTVLEIIPDIEPYWIENYGKVALEGKAVSFMNYSKELGKYYETKSYSPKRGYFAVTFNDVTKRVQSQEQLNKSNYELITTNQKLNHSNKELEATNAKLLKTLKKSEKREHLLNKMFNSVPSVMMILNSRTEVIQMNEVGLLRTGHDQKSIIGLRGGDVFNCVGIINNPRGCGNGKLCKTCGIRNTVETALCSGKDQIKKEANLTIVHQGREHRLNLLVSASNINLDNSKGILVTIDDITDLKQKELKLLEANQKILESESKYKSAFKTSPDAININALDGKYVDINQGFTQLTGYTEDEVIEKKSLDLKIWTKPNDLKKLLEALHANGSVSNLESVLKCKDGSLKTALISASLIELNQKPHILSIARDITANKLNRTYLEKAQEIGKIGTWKLDCISNKLEWTTENYIIFDLPLDHELNLDVFLSLIHPDDQDYVNEKWQAATGGEPYDIEHRIRTKQGKIKWIREKATIEFDDNGNALTAIGVSQDITDHKNAELELKKEIQNSEKLNTSLIETKEALKVKLNTILSPDKDISDLLITEIIELDFLQEIQDLFAEATGVSSIITDLKGEPITKPSNFSNYCTLIRSSLKGKFNCAKSDQILGQKAIHTNKPYSSPCLNCGLIDGATIIRIADKPSAIWLIGQANAGNVSVQKTKKIAKEFGLNEQKLVQAFKEIPNMPEKQFVKVLELLHVFAQELSSMAYSNLILAQRNEELVQKQKEILKAKENAEHANKLKTAFLANISHEIRTPLNGIIGFTDFLVRGQNKSEEKRQSYANIVKSSSDNLLQIINDILDIAKLESDSLKIKKHHFKPSDIAFDLEYIYSKKIKDLNKHIILSADNFDENLELDNDKDRFNQILSNLLDNAIKFTEKGAINYGIETINKGFVTFYVKDTGIGIPKKNQSLIFERFGQADLAPNRVYAGTGLGLSIVNELLTLMGGDIWVESEAGIGSKFLFQLPLNGNHISSKKENKNEIETNTLITPNPALNLLIVEDNASNAMLLEEYISEIGAKSVICANGLDVIKLLAQESFDLILMDIRLPDISGIEVTKIIRSKKIHTPILAQSAYAMEKDVKLAIAAGSNDYIHKPINRNLLFEKINSLVKLKTD